MNVECLQARERTIERRQQDRSRRRRDDGRRGGGRIRLSQLCVRGSWQEQERDQESRDARASGDRHARWPLNHGANRDEARSRRFLGYFRLSVAEPGKRMELYGRAIATLEAISTSAKVFRAD